LFATVVTFLLLVIGIYCSTYFGVKPNSEVLFKLGNLSPSLKSPPPLLVKERGIKGVRLIIT
jgi:hypothetical protein